MNLKQITILLMAVCIFQFAKSQTTETEYTYITKALAEDKGKGRDIKEGYKMRKLYDEVKIYYGKEWRSVIVYSFIKDSINRAFIVECKDHKNNLSYMCIPTIKSEKSIWDRMFNDMSAAGKEWHLVLAYGLSKLVADKLR